MVCNVCTPEPSMSPTISSMPSSMPITGFDPEDPESCNGIFNQPDCDGMGCCWNGRTMICEVCTPEPSMMPSISPMPSMMPSLTPSLKPSSMPSVMPSTTSMPSMMPSASPTSQCSRVVGNEVRCNKIEGCKWTGTECVIDMNSSETTARRVLRKMLRM